MEIVLKLTADPKLETLLDKLCNALDLGNDLPFTAAQVNPTAAGTMALPVNPVTASSAPTATPVNTATPAAPVNPTPAGMTTATTTTAAQVVPAVQPVVTVPLRSALVTTTVPTAPTAPVTTTTTPGANAVQQPTTAPTAAPAATVPTAAPTYQIADLARAAATLMDAGKQPQLLALLAQFGVQSLGQLKPEQFGQFATALRGLGAKL